MAPMLQDIKTRPHHRSRLAVAAAASALITLGSLPSTRAAAPLTRDDDLVTTRGRITSVIAYENWAAITRIASVELTPGRRAVRFSDLPESIEPGSIRADAGANAQVASVSFELRPDDAAFQKALADFDARLDDLAARRSVLDEQLQVLAKEEGLLNAIADRTAQRTGEQIGSGQVDLDEITRVSKYLSAQHADVLGRKRSVNQEVKVIDDQVKALTHDRAVFASGGPNLMRSCLLSINVPADSDTLTEVKLAYLVGGVNSKVAYNVRTNDDLSGARLEYDLLVEQQTGEDWNDVALAYSTVPILDPTAPPSLQEQYVGPETNEPTAMNVRSRTPDEPLVSGRSGLARLVGQVPQGSPTGTVGPVPMTTFNVTTPATVASRGPEPVRLRLATVSLRPVFRYVAAPVIANHAYLRGTISNDTRLHWLPGVASLFLGSEYVGETTLPFVAPGDSTDLFFGTDARIRTQRIVVEERTRTTGLLGDGGETTVDYRIEVSNDSDKPAKIEVWDRIPLARDERYALSSTSISPALSRDSFFRTRQRRQGLLRWDVNLTEKSGSASSAALTYTLNVRYKSSDPPPDIPH